VAQIAKELGLLTVAIVTRPFAFEGKKRGLVAEKGIQALSHSIDSLIILPSRNLITTLDDSLTLKELFEISADIHSRTVKCISDLFLQSGLNGVSFEDIATVMSKMSIARVGFGYAKGIDCAEQAANKAFSSPLLKDVAWSEIDGVLVNMAGGANMKVNDFEKVLEVVHQFVPENTTIVMGPTYEAEMKDEICVTVIAGSSSSSLGNRKTKAING
jgi:cell division protein FtsZ